MLSNNFYLGMVDMTIPNLSRAEETRDKWISNSYVHNNITMVPLTISKYLMVNEALEDRIIRETSAFTESLKVDHFLEGIQIEIKENRGTTEFSFRFVLATPEVGNRWQLRKTFPYTFPTLTDDVRSDIATMLIDIFSHRKFLLNEKTLEWYHGTDQNVHSHRKANVEELHQALVSLMKDDCQITLQRFPMLLRSLNPNGEFARTYQSCERAWSINMPPRVRD